MTYKLLFFIQKRNASYRYINMMSIKFKRPFQCLFNGKLNEYYADYYLFNNPVIQHYCSLDNIQKSR